MSSTQPQNPMNDDRSQRSAERYVSELPIEINGAQGITRNISATGVYFETTAVPVAGAKIHFTVDVIVEGSWNYHLNAKNIQGGLYHVKSISGAATEQIDRKSVV